MAIKPLVQNLEYLKYPNNIIKASEIDNRFNDIVNYLNNEIIFKLNNVNDNIVIGSLIQKDINSILKSKNDVGYLWKKIHTNDFKDNSVDFNKFNFSRTNYSIFISDSTGTIKQANKPNNVPNWTIVKDTNGIKFDKINNNYLDSNTKITSDKIAPNTILEKNLVNIEPTIIANNIIGSHIKDKSITSFKIINNSVNLISFNTSVTNILTSKIWNRIIPNNFINLNSTGNRNNILYNYWDRNFIKRVFYNSLPIGNNKLKPYVVSKDKLNKFYIKNIIKYYNKNSKITDLSLSDPNGNLVGAEKMYLLGPSLFKSNSINANRLVCWYYKLDNTNAHNINKILAKESIDITHLTPAIQAKLV